MIKTSVDVYKARGLLDDYVKSISVEIEQKSGFKTMPRGGYLGNEFRATCERPSGTALTSSPVFVLEVTDRQTEVSVRYGAVRRGELHPADWRVECFVWTPDWLGNLSALLTRATPTIIADVLTVLETAGEIPSRK
jgi:hypothetical protein